MSDIERAVERARIATKSLELCAGNKEALAIVQDLATEMHKTFKDKPGIANYHVIAAIYGLLEAVLMATQQQVDTSAANLPRTALRQSAAIN